MFEHVRGTDTAASTSLISHTYTRVSGEGLATDGGVRKTETKLSNHEDRMDTENIDKGKKTVC